MGQAPLHGNHLSGRRSESAPGNENLFSLKTHHGEGASAGTTRVVPASSTPVPRSNDVMIIFIKVALSECNYALRVSQLTPLSSRLTKHKTSIPNQNCYNIYNQIFFGDTVVSRISLAFSKVRATDKKLNSPKFSLWRLKLFYKKF